MASELSNSQPEGISPEMAEFAKALLEHHALAEIGLVPKPQSGKGSDVEMADAAQIPPEKGKKRKVSQTVHHLSNDC